MNWKIILGGILIFAGIAQFLKVFTEYRYENTQSLSIGLGAVFIAVIILGVYLVREGRKNKLKR